MKEMEDRERKTQELLHTTQNLDSKKSGRGHSKPLDKQLQAQNEAIEKMQKYTEAFDRICAATGLGHSKRAFLRGFRT